MEDTADNPLPGVDVEPEEVITATASKQEPPRRVKTPRLTGLSRSSTNQTQFMSMVMGQHEIPRIHNIMASFFTWILLAGFVIFPGTFAQLGAGKTTNPDLQKLIGAAAGHVPLLVIAGVCAGIGVLGMLWLWWAWRRNYVWLVNKIFLPGCLNSAAGLLSTLISLYFPQTRAWTTESKVTVCITGGCMFVTGTLFLTYDLFILRRVKRDHIREMAAGAVATGEKNIFKRMADSAMGSALDPESVV
ncbi:MAG: hypothetical protein M1813_008615 [Trichoglossum hirsutum]|nr:MAG: hypothetical protein M1813_008615 [Trichoglossum hirsutum]